MSQAGLFELELLSRSFVEGGQTVEALRDVTASIPEGHFVAICGPSGAGKSTLLHILGVLDRGYRGRLRFLGADLAGLSARASTQFRLERIGFVFQRQSLVDAMSVLENVAWPYWRLHGNRRDAFARAAALLENLGLETRLHHHPAKLSGGELQRVALARALVNAPRVTLADEPTASLDEANARRVIETLRGSCRKGHSVVAVTHDPILAAAADLVLHMSYGRLRIG